MRRAFSLAVMVLLPAAALAVIILVIYQPGVPAEGRWALDQYLRSPGVGASSAVAEQVRHAARPGSFTASMSAATFASTSYFQVLHNYQPPATLSGLIWDKPVVTNSLGIAPVPVNYAGQKPLPYPPHDLWCVLLSAAAPAAPQSVFLALHGDLYVDVWVVHELPPVASTSELALQWGRVGCAIDWQH
jgi:hypothetical protein